MSFAWNIKKGFWNWIAITKFKGNKPAKIAVPRREPDDLAAVPFISKFKKIPVGNIVVPSRVPKDEASRLKYYFYQFQVGMYAVLSPMKKGMPPIDADAIKALDQVYTKKHRKYFPIPTLPPQLAGTIDLGEFTVKGPFSGYLQKAPNGDYQWDFSSLAKYEHHPGLYSLGVKVLFRADQDNRKLRAYQIESELGVTRPGDPEWELAKKIALCAASNHTSLVRHFNWVHLAGGALSALITRNTFPGGHPICRLLWQHIYGSQYSNEIVTLGQMAKGGDFPTTFCFTHAGMCKLFEEKYLDFSVLIHDPEMDAGERGVNGDDFDNPAQDNLEALFNVIYRHTHRYLQHYYTTDDAIRHDAQIREWLEKLEKHMPNGIKKAIPKVTVANVARLAANFIYIGTVQHEVLGTHQWNYQLWVHKIPVRVYKNGQRVPIDVYARLVNANFNLNVPRKQLTDDFSYMGLDEAGVGFFKQFQAELLELDEQLRKEPAMWKIYPTVLEANMNA
ncbi:MAG: hypothetical protein AAFZ15_02370 [Bacteroidota bacterium]